MSEFELALSEINKAIERRRQFAEVRLDGKEAIVVVGNYGFSYFSGLTMTDLKRIAVY